jgi:hypothetical protein
MHILPPHRGAIFNELRRAPGKQLSFRELQTKFPGCSSLLTRVTVMALSQDGICFNDNWQTPDDLVVSLAA